MSKFTYTISSRDDTSSLPTSAVMAYNCNILITNFPQKYRYYHCNVKSFVINQGSLDTAWKGLHFIQLISPNFVKIGSALSGNRGYNVLANVNLDSGINNNVGISFIVDNLNRKLINFQLVDERFFNLNGVECNQNTAYTAWSLTLELTGIEDDELEEC